MCEASEWTFNDSVGPCICHVLTLTQPQCFLSADGEQCSCLFLPQWGIGGVGVDLPFPLPQGLAHCFHCFDLKWVKDVRTSGMNKRQVKGLKGTQAGVRKHPRSQILIILILMILIICGSNPLFNSVVKFVLAWSLIRDLSALQSLHVELPVLVLTSHYPIGLLSHTYWQALKFGSWWD